MKKAIKLILSGLLAVVVIFALRTLYLSGSFKQLTPHQKAPLRIVKGMMGAEDIVIDRTLHKALVSSDDRRAYREGRPVKGAIYLLDYRANPPVFDDMTAGFDQKDFHPHGISLYHSRADSTKWLFVVNHRDSGHFIEIFRFTDSSLVHTESISDPAICSPNDVVGTGQRTFFFTNDHDEAGGIDRWKDFLLIGTAQVGYFDGEKTEIFDTGLSYANGINISPDGQTLYVATTTGRQIIVYDKNTRERKGTIDCRTGLDNIELDETGNLWIGCHPKMLAFVAHSKDAQKRSPSQVLKITPNPSDFSKSTITEIYLNDGNPLSGSSVAAPDAGVFLLGTVFENGVGIGQL